MEVKLENSPSLIDFDADPEPPIPAAVPQAQQSTISQSTTQSANSANDNNWASFDVVAQPKVSQAPSNVNSLESVLSQLSISAPAPGHVSGTPGNAGPTPISTARAGNMIQLPIDGDSFVVSIGQSLLPVTANAPAAASVSNLSTFPLSGASVAAPVLAPVLPVNGGASFVNVPGGGQWSTMHHQQPSLFPATGNQSTPQPFIQSVAGPSSNQVELLEWSSQFCYYLQSWLTILLAVMCTFGSHGIYPLILTHKGF